MRLFEIAFMKSLIMAKYRRNLTIFIANGVACLVFWRIIPYLVSENIEFIAIILYAGAALRFFGCYIIGPIDNQSNLPWAVKKREMYALQSNVEAQHDFENLAIYVPLNDYFDIKVDPRRLGYPAEA